MLPNAIIAACCLALAGLRERRACFCAAENQGSILPAEPNVAVRVTGLINSGHEIAS